MEPLSPLPTCPCTKTLAVYRKYCVCQNMIDHCCTSTAMATCSNFIIGKTGKLYILHCNIPSGQSYLTVQHMVTVLISQLLSCLTRTYQYRREGSKEKHNNTATTIRTGSQERFLTNVRTIWPGGRQYTGDAATQLMSITTAACTQAADDIIICVHKQQTSRTVRVTTSSTVYMYY